MADNFTCKNCGNLFYEKPELETHLYICKYKNVNTKQRTSCKYQTTYVKRRNTVVPNINNDIVQSEENVNNVNTDILELLEGTNEIEIIREDDFNPNLVNFTPATIIDPNQIINSLKAADFINKTKDTYEKIVQWRKNLFKLPTGKSGKEFISELTYWLEIFNSQANMKCIAMKVFMIYPPCYYKRKK